MLYEVSPTLNLGQNEIDYLPHNDKLKTARLTTEELTNLSVTIFSGKTASFFNRRLKNCIAARLSFHFSTKISILLPS